jgi:mRNA interferase RelE/StbE
MWKISLSREADKFLKSEKISDDLLRTQIGKFINALRGADENVHMRKLKGKWEGYFRIRIGRMRIILRLDFGTKEIFIDRIDFRGSVYK